MSDFVSPVYAVKSVHMSKVRANAYNPNAVAPPEMKLLEISRLFCVSVLKKKLWQVYMFFLQIQNMLRIWLVIYRIS